VTVPEAVSVSPSRCYCNAVVVRSGDGEVGTRGVHAVGV
jgi:hypothetical protein